MKYLMILCLAVLLAGCGEKPAAEPENDVSAEDVQTVNAPNLTAGIDMANQEVCRTNMLTASSSIVMFQAQTGNLPSSLEEAGISMSCPEHGRYIFTVEGNGWRLECPGTPSHGCIENGQVSW